MQAKSLIKVALKQAITHAKRGGGKKKNKKSKGSPFVYMAPPMNAERWVKDSLDSSSFAKTSCIYIA
jgi:hypothetical protein